MTPPGNIELADGEISLGESLRPLRERWRLLLLAPFAAGLLGLGASYLAPPTYTAKTSFLSPQQQGAAAAALSSLGGLAALAGGAGVTRSPADQYAALIQSTTVADRMIERFELMRVYDTKLRVDARRELTENTRVAVGRRDGMIAVEVDDHNPQRAAAMANQYVEELRTLSARLALSEAQQRRIFFEGLMRAARDELSKAQVALQGSGFNQGALRAEPRAAAETYARVRAEVGAAEVKLAMLRRTLADGAPEVQRGQAELGALKAQLVRVERADGAASQSDYLAKYREFKYQEALFEVFARQFEAARVDEAREGLLIQVVDPAVPPERKSRPKRALIALSAAFAAAVLLSTALVVRHAVSRRRLMRAVISGNSSNI